MANIQIGEGGPRWAMHHAERNDSHEAGEAVLSKLSRELSRVLRWRIWVVFAWQKRQEWKNADPANATSEVQKNTNEEEQKSFSNPILQIIDYHGAGRFHKRSRSLLGQFVRTFYWKQTDTKEAGKIFLKIVNLNSMEEVDKEKTIKKVSDVYEEISKQICRFQNEKWLDIRHQKDTSGHSPTPDFSDSDLRFRESDFQLLVRKAKKGWYIGEKLESILLARTQECIAFVTPEYLANKYEIFFRTKDTDRENILANSEYMAQLFPAMVENFDFQTLLEIFIRTRKNDGKGNVSDEPFGLKSGMDKAILSELFKSPTA